MNRLKLLLIDFDKTLTKYHTTGSLCFSNTKYDSHLNANILFETESNFSDNYVCEPRFMLEKLQQLVDKGVCIGIVTMADNRHAQLREKQLNSEKLQKAYHVLAGRDLVIKWFTNMILKACDLNIDDATKRVETLFTCNRFCIVAMFRENSKREHLVQVVSIFRSFSTLDSLQTNEILYVDDSQELIADMQSFLPGIKTLLVTEGLTENHWKNITENFI